MKRLSFLASICLVALALACGGDEEAAPSAPADAGSLGVEADLAEESEEYEEDLEAFEDESEEGAPRILMLGLSPEEPQPEDEIRAVVQVSSPGGAGYDLSYKWEVAGRSFGGDQPSIRLPKLRRDDAVRVSVLATNASGPSLWKTAEARVPNSPPKIMNLRLREESAEDGGQLWVVETWGQDPNGDEIEYEFVWLVNGRETEHREASIPATAFKRGDEVRVRVVASDGIDESDPAESGSIEVANAAPIIKSTPPGMNEGGRYVYQVDAEDADGDTSLRYGLVQGPDGMEIDSLSGELTWTPGVEQAGKHRIEISVTDRAGSQSTQVFILPINLVEDEAPPASAD